MKKGIIAAAVAAAALSPLAASADDVSYSFVEIDYVDVDLAGTSESGFGLKGSVGVGDNFHVTLDHSGVSFPAGVDLNRTSLGFGYHGELGDNASFYADLAWESIDFGALGDDDGYSIEIGARGMVADSFELQGYVGQIDVGGSETLYGIEGRYYFSDEMAVGLGWESIDNIDTLEVGFRYNFGG